MLALVAVGSAAPAHGQTEDAPIDADVLRRMSLEELLAMDVTSVSRAPEPYAQAPGAIQVITQQQIRRSGVTTIAEALRLATNLHVAQKNSNSWAISARGFNTDLANKLLVLIDGRTVYTPLFSGVFWDRQDYLLEDVDRIEVISGPGGTLWGANAVNGVINVITKRARDTQGHYANGATGPGWGGVTSARFGGTPFSSVAYRIYGKYAERDNEVFPNGDDATDSWDRWQAGFRSEVDMSTRDLVTFQGDVYEGDSGTPTGDRSETSGFNLLARWTRTSSPESDLSLQLYYDRAQLALPTPDQVLGGLPVAPAGTLEDDLDTYDLDFQHRFPLGDRNRLVWGLGYRFTHNQVTNAPSLAFDPPELDRSLVSGFVQDEIEVTPDVTFALGTKVEHNDYTGVELEPSARLTWTTGSARTVWAAVSRAVRMPSRVDRHERLPTPGLAFLGVNNLLVGNDSFRSETLWAYELGYRTRVGSNVAASVSTFFHAYDDLRSTSVSPPDPIFGLPFPFYFSNNLEGTTWGAEVLLDVVLMEPWSLRGGYTLVQQDIEIAPGQADFNNALNETADPEHQLSLFSSLDFPGQVELDAGLRWIGSFQYSESGVARRVPSYTEADARLAWHATEWAEISVTGTNLLNGHHGEYVISSPNPRQEITRSLYAGIAIRW